MQVLALSHADAGDAVNAVVLGCLGELMPGGRCWRCHGTLMQRSVLLDMLTACWAILTCSQPAGPSWLLRPTEPLLHLSSYESGCLF